MKRKSKAKRNKEDKEFKRRIGSMVDNLRELINIRKKQVYVLNCMAKGRKLKPSLIKELGLTAMARKIEKKYKKEK